MSSLSIYQQAELRDAVIRLSAAVMHIDSILSCDAVDELDDARIISEERDKIGKSITRLNSLLNE